MTIEELKIKAREKARDRKYRRDTLLFGLYALFFAVSCPLVILLFMRTLGEVFIFSYLFISLTVLIIIRVVYRRKYRDLFDTLRETKVQYKIEKMKKRLR